MQRRGAVVDPLRKAGWEEVAPSAGFVDCWGVTGELGRSLGDNVASMEALAVP